MTLRDSLLSTVDKIRGIPDTLGVRLYTVTIRVRTWTGARPGIGSGVDADSVFWVDGGTHKPRVVQVTSRDVIASGGMYQDQDLKVGPVTPSYSGGGVSVDAIDPPPGVSPAEVFFKIVGPGMESGGSWFKKINTNTLPSPFGYTFVVRATGEAP